MVNIKQEIIPAGNDNRPGYALKPKYITIHTTQNFAKGANGEMHARFLKNGGGSAQVSWHFTVDDSGTQYQHLPLNENGWHAGDGLHGTGNRQSIGIEICENKDGNFEKAVGYAIELVAYLMKKLDIDLDHVVPHKHWSGKQCPRYLLSRWDEIVDRVAKESEKPKTKPAKDPQPLPEGKTYKIENDDTYFKIAMKLGIKASDLQAANPGVDPLKLKVGQVLNLSPQRPAIYTIKPGDTLWEIAHDHKGLTVGDLIKANPDIDPDALKVGQVIKLTRSASPAPKETAPKKESIIHKVTQAVKKNPYKLPTKTLKRGDRGDDVKLLQTALNALHFKVGAVDGSYGAKTEDAVKRFQSMFADVKDDGIFGSATREKAEANLKKMYA